MANGQSARSDQLLSVLGLPVSDTSAESDGVDTVPGLKPDVIESDEIIPPTKRQRKRRRDTNRRKAYIHQATSLQEVIKQKDIEKKNMEEDLMTVKAHKGLLERLVHTVKRKNYY